MSGILVYGPPGSGKSTAIESLNPKSTAIICSDMKPLPFRGWKSKYKTVMKDGQPFLAESNYVQTRKPSSVLKSLQVWNDRNDIKVIVWDTMTHVMTDRFMTDPKTDWDFYIALAKEIYAILNYISKINTDVIVIGHNETIIIPSSGQRMDTIRTIGKLLDQKIEISSLFTVVLMTQINRDSEGISHYYFVTQSDGSTLAKSPRGMFKELLIPNNYHDILTVIHKYDE